MTEGRGRRRNRPQPSKCDPAPLKKHKAGTQPLISTFFTSLHRQVTSPAPPPACASPAGTALNDRAVGHTKLIAITANVPGLWTHKQDITTLIYTHRPHILTLVDVRLHKNQRNSTWLKTLLKGYQYWISTAQEDGRGVRGVIVAVRSHLASLGHITVRDKETDGRVMSITLTLPHSQPMDINGVYAPAGTSPSDEKDREHMYSQLTMQDPHRFRLDMGDWNATLFDEDRNSNLSYPKDHAHRSYASNNGLKALDRNGQRAHTYRHGNVNDGSMQTSRIDDILSNRTLDATMTALSDGHLSDHAPLLAQINMAGTGIFIPCERKPIPGLSILKLVTPISAKDKIAFAEAVNNEREGQSQQIHLLDKDLTEIIEHDVIPFNASLGQLDGKTSHRLLTLNNRPATEVMISLADRYNAITSTGRAIAMTTCDTKLVQQGGIRHRTRSEKAERAKLKQTLRMTRALQTEASSSNLEDPHLVKQMIETTSLPLAPADRDRWVKSLSPDEDPTLTMTKNAPQQLLENERIARKQLLEWDKAEDKENRLANISRNRHLLHTKPKQANRQMNGAGTHDEYPALTDEATGTTTDDPKAWTQMLEKHFRQKQAPPLGMKTGKYHPTETPRDYPWSSDLDPFTLETGASQLPQRKWLHDRILDPTVFNDCLKSLKHNKSPGPDGVENEILQMMPETFHKCLHKLMIVMWATGITPDSWKESHTSLLNKDKGDQTLIKNRRPIGLLNSSYKLWTKFTTRALYDYAEQHRILSPSQKGFCKYASTMHQLQLFIMALEDARLTGQNIFNIQVDFTCAFNTICHDRLLQTMYDLGFPTDAIDVVKNLYTGATTRIKFSDIITAAIPVNRGSIQGDSLSPFLFLCMMEPMLRWLQVGGRGYTFGCIADHEERIKNNLSNAAFADDLSILTTSIPDLKLQADKLSRYADWAHLEVNTEKTTVSGLLYRNITHSPYGKKDAISQVRAQLEGQITVQRQPVRYLDPREPFRYLGAMLTLSLDWKFQHQAIFKKAKEKIERLIAFRASSHQIRHVINTSIKPSVTNTFGIIPMTKTDIHILDRCMNQAIRQANGLPPRTPTAFLHEDEDAFGMGAESLLVDYAHKHAALLTESLRDTGRIGTITKALLTLQLRLNHTTPHQAKYCLRVRQLAMMHDSEITLLKNDIPQFDVPTPILQALKHLNPHNSGHPASQIPCEFLQPLFQLGITSLSDLMEPSGTHIMDGNTLKRSPWGGGAKAKHIVALNRLSRLLNEEPACDYDIPSILRHRNPDPSLASKSRRIHPGHMHITSIAINTLPNDVPAPVTHLDQSLITAFLRREGRLPVAIITTPEEGPTTRSPTPDLPPPAQPNAISGKRARTALMKCPTLHRDKQYKQTRIRTHVEPIATEAPKPGSSVMPCPCQTHAYKRTYAYNEMSKTTTRNGAHRAAKVVETLYSHTSTIDAVLGWRMVTEDTHRKRLAAETNPSKRTERIKQIQYLTQWAATYVEDWALTIFEMAGYKAKSVTPVKRSDFAGKENDPQTHACIAACEVCFNPWSRADTDGGDTDDMFACDKCHKHYHAVCLGQHQDWAPPSTTWHCPACISLREGETPPEDLVRVEWCPTWEPEETLRSTIASREAVDVWVSNNHDQPPARLTTSPIDSHLTNMERQGFLPTDSNRWQTTMGEAIRNRVVFEQKAINPHLDIFPTGECKIEIRHTDIHNPINMGSPTSAEVSCFYARDGRCMGTRTVDRLVTLRQLHDTHNTRPTSGTSFPADAIDLINRYRPRGDDIRTTQHWRLPPNITKVLMTTFRITTERLSNPLMVNASTLRYWSECKHDQAFGAHIGSYTVQWQGSSQAFLPTDAPSQEKAIRWAIWSAKASRTPTSTVLYLPRGPRSRGSPVHTTWTRDHPQWVQHLGRTTGNCPLYREYQWAQDSTDLRTPPNVQLDIIVVWNAAAREALSPSLASLGPDLQQAFALHRPHSYTATKLHLDWGNLIHTDTVPHSTQKFRQAGPETDSPTTNLPLGPTPKEDILRDHGSDCSALRYEWQQFAYTDGSCISEILPGGGKRNHIGAGVWIPAAPPGGQHIHVDPRGEGATNEINRAEAAGIWAALHRRQRMIATDSATVLSQIQKGLLSPMNLRNHKHREMIGHIVAAMQDILNDPTVGPQEKIHLCKVKAHNGLVGNDIVDGIAKEAAHRTKKIDITCPVPSEPSYTSNYWPHRKRTLDNGAQRTESFVNLNKDLHSHMHDKHRMGHCNRDGIYYRSWQAIKEQVDTTISMKYAHTTTTPFGARRICLMYRHGTLWNNKAAFRCRMRTNADCPLCRREDGVSHIAGGCSHPAMARMFTERHNHTGRILLKAISKGGMGSNLVMADLGSADKCAEDDAPILPRSTLPNIIRRILDSGHEAGAPGPYGATSRPDAIIITEESTPTIILIEFKYCKDTQPTNQLQACRTQHAALIKSLTQAFPSHTIKFVPILLGHSGTIYKQYTLASMKEVGIDCAHTIKCATKMHLDAIQHLHSIVKTRRHLESHPALAGGHPTPLRPEHPTGAAATYRRSNKRHRSADKPP